QGPETTAGFDARTVWGAFCPRFAAIALHLAERHAASPIPPGRLAGLRGDQRTGPPMKYAIVIPDGCADEPQASLGGKPPLRAAHKPNMDRIARTGIVGRANNVPASLPPASDVATLSLFGYDPLQVYTGRAPLETAAMGITLGPE